MYAIRSITLAAEAAQNNAVGVICGHIHHAADRPIDGIRYMNCGDWVESCTALVEEYNGTFRIIRFADELREKPIPVPAPPSVVRAA